MIGSPRGWVSLPRGLAPLGYWNFALYFCGFAASNTGRWIELTGALWLTYELTQSPVLLGFLGVARAVPAIILSPFAGVVADRVDKRRLLFTTQAIGIVISFCLGVLVALGLIQVWHIYLGVALQASITAFDASARQTLFPQLIPRDQLAAAVTLNITAGRLAKFVGPIIGGFGIAILGEASPFLLNSASFAVLMATLVLMRDVAPSAWTAGLSFGRELTEGMRYILNAPVFAGLFKMEIFFGVLEMNPVMIAIVAREVLDAGPEEIGLLLAAPALGSLIGILWLLVMGQAKRLGRFSLCCTLVYSAGLVAFAISYSFVAAFIALAIIGILDALVTITRNSVLQLAAPEGMRGRIMANMGMITRGVSPLAETQSGILAAVLGPPAAVICAASALALAVGLTARLNPVLWNFVMDDASLRRGGPEKAPADPL